MVTAIQSKSQQVKPSNSGYAPVNGINIYYEVHGEGQPIILLHGAFMTIGTNWGQLIPELSKTRKVIAIELQGHGHTAFSVRKFDHTTFAKDVDALMGYLNVESSDIVGYSFGASIAYKFAILYPKRLKKLVIISGVYKSTGWLPQINDAFKGMKPEFFTNSPMQVAYDAVAPDTTKWASFLKQMIALAGKSFDFGDANISKIAAPVLIISGDNDGMDKMELIKTYQFLGGGIAADFGKMPKSQLAVVPGQSHVSLMTQTSILLDYLDNFLK
ncbi:alpha/beta hydrolase [Sphingobacterium sp. N143]|uniref:alpha/beta fold hydrolase n=1 Tax=Sphingobacterium sp. N143 TaxID=2746727 RepID=UPI002574C2C6|nr:alpha/beta hydrolase [Sphingobacterium sp. N143]MDM1295653.1 alpha/beta hydrolase [Sphingobacterium sp. N143]